MNLRSNKIWIYLLILMLFLGQKQNPEVNYSPESNTPESSSIQAISYYFIKFDGDNWDTSHFPGLITILGDGTPTNPYIIENINFPFSVEDDHFIFIYLNYNSSSSPKSVVIRNCTFPPNSPSYYLSYPIYAKDDDYNSRGILSSYLEVSNCTFRNVAYNSPCCFLSGMQNCRVTHCDIRDMEPFYITGCRNTTITDNFLYNCDGIEVGGNNTVISRNTFQYMQSRAIELSKIDTILIESNIITYSPTPIDLGGYYYIHEDYYSGSSNIIVRNNTISYASQNAIEGIGSKNVLIEDNTIVNCSETGISIEGNENTTISRNNIHNCIENGILIKNSKKISVKENLITDSGNYGVWFDNTKKRTIEDNFFSDNLEGDFYYSNIFGSMYLNKNAGEIAAFWFSVIYIVGIFVMYKYRDIIKKYFKYNNRYI